MPLFMQQCLLVHDKSLRFSKVIYGILALISFLFLNSWLVLATSILMFLAAFSVKFNFPYQLHSQFLKKLDKNKPGPIKKGTEELSFTFGMGGVFLLGGFLLLYLGKFVNFAWILTLIMSLLMLLGGFTDFCAASLTYALYCRIFKRKKW
jgi:ABC-type transport system involved in cytochrome bd biosynthesis fused ATPase/permease subunit